MAAMIDQSLAGPVFRIDSMEQQGFLNSYTNCLMMEKRQLFLRSYQFSRKRTLSERIRRCLIRSKRVIWSRLRCVRKLRKLVWSKLFKLRHGFGSRRQYSRLFRLLSSNSYYYSSQPSE
ncbi:uncharacterized protein LOC116197510 [Punica granatum]|uniref:Uncharacterized protein n=2 Tax=Punica granatum TaxID=22663 RepID=A0A218WIF8_PUNGR|nr:uncharacterized protein LOC116197510 [Punica granatum]OWM72353.1 hypothetical protein CDL15_Pgr018238 [Punica granatum]PKI55518.1 hypothetical protein CRG98_024130 [Punica granatum]